MALPRGEEQEPEEGNELFAEDLPEENQIPIHSKYIIEAFQTGDVDALRHALDVTVQMGGNINEAVEDGDSPLHLACLYGYLPCVQLLLDRGANIEVTDEDGAIPLHDACAGGFTDIVQLLLYRADGAETVKRMLETVDAEGDTPLHHAARGEHADVIRLLLASGASITKQNSYGKTPREEADPRTEAAIVLEAAVHVAKLSVTVPQESDNHE